MAKKKKPVETIEVVEIEEAVVQEVPAADDVDVELLDIELADADIESVADEVDNLVDDVPEEAAKSGVLPLILGGVVAAILGFTAARSNMVDNFLPPSWRMNAGEIALQSQITSTQLQLQTLTEKLSAMSSKLANASTADETLSTQVEELVARVVVFENRPVVASAGSPDFGGDFATLRVVAEKQQAAIDALLMDARLAEQTSQNAASNTLARAAANSIIAAIESGAPFAAALVDLEAAGATDIPEALRTVAGAGVVTLATLQDAIPDASRAALAATPAAADSGWAGFLKRQLGARSVAPREGGDADAILSRVEGAVRQGQLTVALEEAETLPQEAQSAMSDWIENAATRLAVTSASETLMQRLAAN